MPNVKKTSFRPRFLQREDYAIHWINLYLVDNTIRFDNTYPLDGLICLWTTGPASLTLWWSWETFFSFPRHMSHRFWKRRANKYIMKTLRGKTVILDCCKEKSLQKTLAYRAKSSFLLPFFRCFVAVPHWNLPRPKKKAVNFNIVKIELSNKPKKCAKRVRAAQEKGRSFFLSSIWSISSTYSSLDPILAELPAFVSSPVLFVPDMRLKKSRIITTLFTSTN